MTPEMLKPLLLDRALGELTPEVAALLDAHLARDPDAARQAAEYEATLRFARDAVAAPNTPPRRPLDLDLLRRAQRTQISRLRRIELLRLAACLAFGLAVGWLARTPAPPPTLAVFPPPALITAPAAHPASSFWSLSRLAAAQRTSLAIARRHEGRYDLNWTTLPKTPRLEVK